MSPRQLATSAVSSTLIPFNVIHTSTMESRCFDFGKWCTNCAFAQTTGWTGSNGNAAADAYVWLYANSACRAFSKAYAKACSFTVASGKLNVTTATFANYKKVSLSISLDTAVSTLALAESKAVAEAFASVETYAFTSVASYFINKSPFCGGWATAKLTQFGAAKAGAKGQSGAVAMSGAVTDTKAAVEAVGATLASVNGVIGAEVASW